MAVGGAGDGTSATFAGVVGVGAFSDQVVRVEAVAVVAAMRYLDPGLVTTSPGDEGDNMDEEGGLRLAPCQVQVPIPLCPDLPAC